jgi:translation initiation factor 3 subunit A
MPPPPHSRPENVLKRAQELIGVGQSQAALSILHEHVVSKRTRNNPISSLEPVMLLFVQLCVDLRKGKLAKDGLYQYKNTAQNTNVGTIQVRSPGSPRLLTYPARLQDVHPARRSQGHRGPGQGR